MQFVGNRYEILDYNSEIEVGKLYKARDTYYNSFVYISLIEVNKNVMKNFKPDFIDEITTLKEINSSYISKNLHIDVHCDEYDVYYYIVSEYFEGQTLKEYIYNNILDKNSIINIVSQIVKALEIANTNNLYHGNLNPNNILIDSNENIKIFDFGITKSNKGINLRQNGDLSYLCPHQLNIDYTDKDSDLFVLGIILFEMIFREHPFGHAYNDNEMLKLVDKGVKWSLLIYDESLTELVKISQKLLSRKKEYKNASEILIDLSYIMYEEVDVDEEEDKIVYEEEECRSNKANLKKKLVITMFTLLLVITIVIGYL